MSARNDPALRAMAESAERDALAALLVRHAPRGDVRAAEALAATAMNRRRRRERHWAGGFADTPFALDTVFAELLLQPVSVRADAAWNAICRRVAARALAGAGPDPTRGAWLVQPADAPVPDAAPALAACLGTFAFYREA